MSGILPIPAHAFGARYKAAAGSQNRRHCLLRGKRINETVSKALAIVRATSLMKVSAVRILPWGSLAAIGVASAAAALPAWMVKTQVHLHPIPLLMLMGTAFAISYAGLVLGFGLLSEGERLAVTGWLRRPALVKVREVEGS